MTILPAILKLNLDIIMDFFHYCEKSRGTDLVKSVWRVRDGILTNSSALRDYGIPNEIQKHLTLYLLGNIPLMIND
jgi:hypothetical protein